MKKTVCLLLCLLMAGSLLASCGNGDAETKQTETKPNADSNTDTESESVEETESFDPGLPDMNFDGRTFSFLTKSAATYNEWAETSLFSEGTNGEVLNDAVYTRNAYVEETYNCKIGVIESGDFGKDVGNAVTAGDTIYDVLNDVGTLVKKGQLVDLTTVGNLDLSKPWWDQRSIADLSIAHKLYMVSGDISTLNNDAT